MLQNNPKNSTKQKLSGMFSDVDSLIQCTAVDGAQDFITLLDALIGYSMKQLLKKWDALDAMEINIKLLETIFIADVIGLLLIEL